MSCCQSSITKRVSLLPLVIDPRSGLLAIKKPQAIIVFANDCTAAHAYAIAFQVLEWDQVLTMLPTFQGVMACRIRMYDGEASV